eukprot:s3310_g12.t1
MDCLSCKILAKTLPDLKKSGVPTEGLLLMSKELTVAAGGPDECSKIKGCESIAVCISPGHTQNCHYKSKKVTLDEAASSHPKKLKECKMLYKTKCKDKRCLRAVEGCGP